MNAKEYVFKQMKKFTKKKINTNSNISEIGIDSLDLVEAIDMIEKDYKIFISNDELMNIKIVQNIIDLIESKNKKQNKAK